MPSDPPSSDYERLLRLAALGDTSISDALSREATRRNDLASALLACALSPVQNAETWSLLCDNIDTLKRRTEPPAFESALTRCAPWVLRWNPMLRTAPAAWLDRLRHPDAALSPEFTLLGSLNFLSRNILSRMLRDEGVLSLCTNPHLQNLYALDLRNNALTSDAAQHLAHATFAASLRVLRLSYNPIGPDGAQHLARSRTLKHLEILELRDCAIADRGVHLLTHTGHARHIKHLDLGTDLVSRSTISAEGANSIASAPKLTALEHLDLSHNPIGARGLSHLLISPTLRALKHLALIHCNISGTDPELELLRVTKLPLAPETLLLTSNPLTGIGPLFAQTSLFASVRKLDVSFCRLTTADLEALLSNPHLKNIRSLKLHYNDISPRSFNTLTARSWPALRKLTLSLPPTLGPHCVYQLANAPWFPLLRRLRVAQADPTTAQTLRQTTDALGILLSAET